MALAESSTQTLPVPPAISPERTLSVGQWGMVAFLLSEVAFFGTLVAVYVAYLHRDKSGPTPAETLHLPLIIGTTCCLLLSSVMIHRAEKALEHGDALKFRRNLAATIALGVLFLLGTGWEWRGLILHDGLTISRNLFGSSFYTLVGFHGFHVSVGVLTMMIVLGLALSGARGPGHAGFQLVSWYWHFVDVVWVIVFAVVYL